ncbi:arsenate reductase [Glaciecola punicea]|uniref:Spx/MgsR family RNA polymerase-binding regulatory protein n=1 Tax=Glaciecola punicea TaxID=56804 RepID=UPI000872F93A|nr:Spx/MgsR family RNA polymerase-binding regulatory protein [Glaciecola punicea]OFA33149.1 arsenate reductase [Glaciecola punicea]
MLTMYGIPNCDTVKKAKKWLASADIKYTFHDYKKLGVPRGIIEASIAASGIDTVLNKRGTTYRKLSDEEKSIVDAQNEDNSAVLDLLCEHSSLIKRPLLVKQSSDTGQVIIVGFNDSAYQEFLYGA